MQKPTPNYTFPEVAELLEIIFLHLDAQDIVCATGVCRYWRNCVRGAKLLRRRTFKLSPMHIANGENPHFEPLTEASREAVIPHHTYNGRRLWSTLRTIEDNFLVHIGEETEPHEADEKDSRNYEDEDSDATASGVSGRYWDRMHILRCGFKDVRYPNGWPVGLRELHCDLCDAWHTAFKLENLHPLLRFLGDMSMCFRGHGSRLIIELAIVNTSLAPKSCFEHSCLEAIEFAKHLQRLCLAVASGGEGVATDSMAEPCVTKLLWRDAQFVRNDHGLTLAEVAPVWLRVLRGHFVEWRYECYNFQHNEVVRWSRAERDSAAAFPTKEDWDKHMAAFSEVTQMWVDAIAEVDVILSVVPAWKSITAEDVGEIQESYICL